MNHQNVVELVNPYSRRKVSVQAETYVKIKSFIIECMMREPEMSMNRLLDLATASKSELYGDETGRLILLVKQDMMAKAEMKQRKKLYRTETPIFVLAPKQKRERIAS